MKITYFVEVTSSWCYWAEPMWAELKARFAGRAEFDWKIALMTADGYPVSREQCDWFYRRSGTIMRSPFMLNSGWMEPGVREYPAPSIMAEAARDFGATDDRVRLALAHATVREGQKTGRWEVAAAVAAKAANLDEAALLKHAQEPGPAARARVATAEFHALQAKQRPAFFLENAIGDRAMFSGIVRIEPIAAAVEAMLADAAAYASHKTHFGDAPAV